MKRNPIATSMLAAVILAPLSVAAEGAAGNFSEAGAHSAQASGHAVVGGAQFSAGAAAVPLAFSGEAGRVSGAVGADLQDYAHGRETGPLPIGRETITAGPSPAAALRSGGPKP